VSEVQFFRMNSDRDRSADVMPFHSRRSESASAAVSPVHVSFRFVLFLDSLIDRKSIALDAFAVCNS